MRTQQTHHSPTRVLRELSRVLRSQADRHQVDLAGAEQVHAAQVQLVRNFRM